MNIILFGGHSIPINAVIKPETNQVSFYDLRYVKGFTPHGQHIGTYGLHGEYGLMTWNSGVNLDTDACKDWYIDAEQIIGLKTLIRNN
jgi:hypothetical protein